MTLVDTSVWVDFFHGQPRARPLSRLLEENQALIHRWVIGELALGGLRRRDLDGFQSLSLLPPAPMIEDDEVLALIEGRRLDGKGLGWVDAALLASALVAGSSLWTFDGHLVAAAAACGVIAS